MADGISATLDSTGLEAAQARLMEAFWSHIKTASKETADAIVREARGRLSRQLGPNATGKSVAGITAHESGSGYVVTAEREPLPKLPLWLEKGTKHGRRMAARPFFYVSALLEQGAHQRRIAEAVQNAIEESGLGD